MKSFRLPLLAGLVALFGLFSVRLVAAEPLVIAPASETLYVKADSPDLIAFHHYRLAEVDGSELILATLKKTAGDQARFAKYPGKVEVLDDEAKAPEGAAVLLLTWNGERVSATLQRGKREKDLGLVSAAPLAGHPDYAQMRRELDRGTSDERSDARLRTRTEMNLYEALRLVQRYQAKA
jgi:hypothetical protein